MDYQFGRDLYGQFSARFSTEHLAIGLWLEGEISDNAPAINRILDAVRAIRTGQKQEYQLIGHEYSLVLSRDGAEVAANGLDGQWPDASPFDPSDGELQLWDEEQRCQCGLEDFEAMMKEWRSFLG